MEVLLMLTRTLAGLAFVLAVSAFNTSPASAFGWCGWGYGASYSPRAYSYAPRTYYRPRARFYRPAYYGRRFVGRAYRPTVARGVYRSGIGSRSGIQRAFGTGDLAARRGRLP